MILYSDINIIILLILSILFNWIYLFDTNQNFFQRFFKLIKVFTKEIQNRWPIEFCYSKDGVSRQ